MKQLRLESFPLKVIAPILWGQGKIALGLNELKQGFHTCKSLDLSFTLYWIAKGKGSRINEFRT